MGWSYPDLSIEDLLKLIKTFIDMLILASGYQSTGRLAHWDSDTIKRSFEWALFLENASKGPRSSADYEDSVEELDAALHELTLSPHFPQGLGHLSCATLGRARDLVLKHLIYPLPLRETHLNALISASVQMDLSKCKRIDYDVLDLYLEKLMQIPSKTPKLSESRNFEEDVNISAPDAVPIGKHDNWGHCDFTELAIQHIEKRKLALSQLSAVQVVSENLWTSIVKELGSTSNCEPLSYRAEELPLESVVWNRWRSRCLSYILDKRTVRLISGASLICSAPECQWAQVFKRLDISVESDDFCETIELLLLGCTANRWSSLIQHLMSISYESLIISRICHEVFNLPRGMSSDLFGKEALVNPKEKCVVDHLEVLLGNQINQLWKLPPVLAAVAIPARSQLFRSYLLELECQFRGNPSATRHCNCIADTMQHRECEVAERIWCLYMFHFCGSHATSRTPIIA